MAEPSELRLAYKKAAVDWVAAIRAEEALATADHSMTAIETWDAARFREQEVQTKATDAREAYLHFAARITASRDSPDETPEISD